MDKEKIFATENIDNLTVYEFLTECTNEEFTMLEEFMTEIKAMRNETDEE